MKPLWFTLFHFYPLPVGEGDFRRARILSGVSFFVGPKTTSYFFWNLNMTFLAKWGCASDFLKMLPKFKMAARGQLQT